MFVSSDFEEEDQFNYIKEANMKFLTLPIDSNVSFHLSEKLGVEGIPSVAIVSPTGKVLTLKGTDHISDNSENAPASRVRDGTSILKWYRRFSQDNSKDNWGELIKLVSENNQETKTIIEEKLTDEKYKEFLKTKN